MIEQVSFQDYRPIGPQGDLVKFISQGDAVLDYKIHLSFDEDPRFVRLEARKANGPTFVQLLTIAHIVSITIGPDPKPAAPRGRPPNAKNEGA